MATKPVTLTPEQPGRRTAIGAAAAATLTPELSRRARRELGMSQNEAIKESGILAYKLKQWLALR